MKLNKLTSGIAIGIVLIIAILIYIKIVESNTSLLNCEEVNLHEREYDSIIYLCNNNRDSVVKSNCSVEVINHNHSLIDKINKWSHTFHEEYFNVIPKDLNSKFILAYCPRSGIMEGYKLFPNKSHDLYLLDRSNGKIVKKIKIEQGIDCAQIYNNYIYFRFYDPVQIYKCKI